MAAPSLRSVQVLVQPEKGSLLAIAMAEPSSTSRVFQVRSGGDCHLNFRETRDNLPQSHRTLQ